MHAPPGAIAQSPSWRRADERQRPSLDYSTCVRVEEDIPSCIHDLFLSHPTYRSPRTPWVSDKIKALYKEDLDGVGDFDFSTARSVAEEILSKFDRLWLPNSSIKEAYGGLAMSLGQKSIKSTSSYGSSSMNETTFSGEKIGAKPSSTAIDDIRSHDPLMTCSPSCYPIDEKKPSTYRWTLSLKPKEHPRPQYELKTISPTVVNVGSKLKVAFTSYLDAASDDTRNLNEEEIPSSAQIEAAPDHLTQHPRLHERDLFYAHSPEHLEEGRTSEQAFKISGSPVGAVLPLPIGWNVGHIRSTRRYSLPSSPMPAVSSRSSYNPKIYSPSVGNQFPRASAVRHSLLKPSVTDLHPVDLGLPVQPVLSKSTDPPSIWLSPETDKVVAISHTHGPPPPAPANLLAKLLTNGEGSNFMRSTKDRRIDSCSTDMTINTFHSEIISTSKLSSPAQSGVFIPAAETMIANVVHDTVSQITTNDNSLTDMQQGETAREYKGAMAVSPTEGARYAYQDVRRPSARDEYLLASQAETFNPQSRTDSSFQDTRTAGLNIYANITAKGPQNPVEAVPIVAIDDIASYTPNNHPIWTESKTTYFPSMVNQIIGVYQSVAENGVTTDGNSFDCASLEKNNLGALPAIEQDSLPREEDERKSTKNTWSEMSWKDSLNGESTSSYTVVPPHDSSLGRKVPAPRMKTLSIPARKHILKQFVAKADQNLQSAQSAASLTPHVLSISHAKPSESPDRRSTSTKQSNGDLSLQWLRDVISRGEPFATQLTALPQRAQWQAKDSLQSPEPNQVGDLQGTPPKPNLRNSGLRASETFTRTIIDLENLLNEALQIASQAAENNDQEHFPPWFHHATDFLQEDSQSMIRETLKPHTAKNDTCQRVPRSQMGKDAYSLDSVHESVRSILSNSSYDSSAKSLHKEHVFDHDVPSKLVIVPISDATTVQPALAPRSPATWPHIKESIKEADKRKIFGRSAIRVLADAIKNSSSPSKSRRVPSIRDGNTEPTDSSCLSGEQHKDASYRQYIRVHETKSPTVPSRKSSISSRSMVSQTLHKKEDRQRVKTTHFPKNDMDKEVPGSMQVFHQPSIQPRGSSLAMRKTAIEEHVAVATTSAINHGVFPMNTRLRSLKSVASLSSHQTNSLHDSEPEIDFSNSQGFQNQHDLVEASGLQRYELKDSDMRAENLPQRHISGRLMHEKLRHLKHDRLLHLSLRGKSHVSIRDHVGFSLSRSHKRKPVARDWSPGRKRFVASVACLSTALIGVIVGIYAGEVPSIQYYIADFNHYAILGNVFFFIGIALTTFLFWPLPLLHGRKPYILTSMTIAMPLLFPQAISVSIQRSPYVAYWRVGLLLPRALMGCALGFANVNFMATLTDLFGASLMSGNPHQETVDPYDVRRHGGGLGVWLGIWTWCYMGSIGFGFFIGAWIINTMSPDWGFYVTIILIAIVLFLNVLTPEVRRSAFRRSVTEVRTQNEISRRLARGEIMMHRLQTGPKWWGEEFHQGVMLSRDMIRQPGFLVMSLYVAWMYGQIVLTIVLLGSLMSKYYRFTSPFVGLTTMAIPFGALLSVPFQKASLFSRARHHPQRTDSMTFDRKITPSSHLIRRGIFTLVLPFAGLAYTLSSRGPPTPFILPVLFAGLIGFLSNLAIAECNGIIMETFDTSDLQPGMTGRPRGASGERTKHKRTNYSSFPRISSAFAITQALGFLIAAAATGVGGVAERNLGAMAATGVMAGILFILTILFLAVLIRWKQVQIVPSHRQEDIELWERQRQTSVRKQEEAEAQGTPVQLPADGDEMWRPVIIGNPSGKFRRMSILELGNLSRWSEIRRKNRLIDEMSYAAQHPNLATLGDVKKEIIDVKLGSLRGSLRRDGSKGGRPGLFTREHSALVVVEQDDGDLGERRVTA